MKKKIQTKRNPIFKKDGSVHLGNFHKAYQNALYRLTRMQERLIHIEADQDVYKMALMIGFRDLYEPLHRPFCDFLMDATKKKKLWLMPRKHFKTTIGNLSYVLWRIVRNPKIKILLFSSKRDLARDFLSGIKSVMETNPNFRARFGDYVGKKVWNKDAILVKPAEEVQIDNVYTVETAGVDEAVTSKHYDLVLFDDIVSIKNYKKQEARLKVEEKYDEAVDNLLKDGGEVVVLGTRWHFDDLYSKIIREDNVQNGGEFHCVVREVSEGYTDRDHWWTGKLIFPTAGRNMEDYKRMESKKPYLFWSNYMNWPRMTKGKPLNPELIQYYGDYFEGEIDWSKAREWGQLTDPAGEKGEYNCSTSSVQFCRYGRHVIITRLFKDRLETDEILDKSMDMLSEAPRITDWRIEDGGGGHSHLINYAKNKLAAQIKRRDPDKKRLSPNIEIDKVRPENRDKDDRIKQLGPYIKDGTFLFPDECWDMQEDGEKRDMMKMFIAEMDEFPLGANKDLLDIVAYILDFYGWYDYDYFDESEVDNDSKKSYNTDKIKEGKMKEGEPYYESRGEEIRDRDLEEVITLD